MRKMLTLKIDGQRFKLARQTFEDDDDDDTIWALACTPVDLESFLNADIIHGDATIVEENDVDDPFFLLQAKVEAQAEVISALTRRLASQADLIARMDKFLGPAFHEAQYPAHDQVAAKQPTYETSVDNPNPPPAVDEVEAERTPLKDLVPF